MRKFVITCLICATSAMPRAALAWDDEGHRIVALVAEHYLSPTAKKKVDAILKKDVFFAAAGLSGRDIASEATWADVYQDSDKNTTRELYNRTYAWHFADIQAARPNIPAACFGQPALSAGTPASRGPAKACVIDKVNQFTDELADSKTNEAERLLALKYLLNLMGDLHQPLRVADEGNAHGMLIPVSASNITPGDLFDYWDGAFVKALGADSKEAAERLVANISDDDAHLWASGNPQLWALEAHQLGVDLAYGVALGNLDNQNSAYILSDKDVNLATRAVATQLSRAGVRLAYVLNNALSPTAVAAKPIPRGDAATGRALALATCSVCHMLSPDQPSPREFTTAPDFQAIANTRGISDVALNEFLFGRHPTMPNMELSKKQADDLIAFIIGLRKTP